MGKTIYRHIIWLACLILVQTWAGKSHAQTSEELDILRMFYKEKDLVVSATRHEKPVSQVAENVTIVTAAEIREMNAHTLTDVLKHITGVQLDIRGGVGSVSNINIQGSDYRHVLVMIDGVTLNNLSDNFADIGAVPVQNIERVEIIKGPASSSWGSSLGGVINIVTKSSKSSEAGNMLSASYGEKRTGDFRAETSGKSGRLGYYLSAGRLESDGFMPSNQAENDNIYAKVQVDIGRSSNLTLTTGFIDGMRGMGENIAIDRKFDNDYEYLYSSLRLSSSVSERTDIEFSLGNMEQDTYFVVSSINNGLEKGKYKVEDRTQSASLKFVSRQGRSTLVMGADYEKGALRSDAITADKYTIEKWAVYINDTFDLNRLSVTPGIRYDDISTNKEFVSPSLGATYKLSDTSLLRADIARGFSVPPLPYTLGAGFFFIPNPDLEVEKVWSYQLGLESTAISGLWAKATLFRHEVEDAIIDQQVVPGTFTKVNQDEMRRQGIELELETTSVRNISFKGGVLYQDAKNLETDERLENVAEYTVDLGLRYDDRESLTGLLEGHYIWWNETPGDNGDYNSIIWDLSINKGIHKGDNASTDAFVKVHNIFDGSQYLAYFSQNPGRWVEAGAMIHF